MADFLNRLAGRALGVIPLAEPLVPGRFSPGGEQGSRLAAVAMAPSVERDAPPEVYGRRHPHDVESRSDSQSQYGEVGLPETNAHDFRTSHPDPAQAAPESAGREFPGTGAHLQESRSRAEVLPQHTSEQQLTSSHDAVSEITWRDPPAGQAAVRPPFAEPFSIATPASTRGVTEREAQPDGGGRTPASTVRVTIGRIEVRAEIASPPPVPPLRARSSTLSLDQFLKQSAGGR